MQSVFRNPWFRPRHMFERKHPFFCAVRKKLCLSSRSSRSIYKHHAKRAGQCTPMPVPRAHATTGPFQSTPLPTTTRSPSGQARGGDADPTLLRSLPRVHPVGLGRKGEKRKGLGGVRDFAAWFGSEHWWDLGVNSFRARWTGIGFWKPMSHPFRWLCVEPPFR